MILALGTGIELPALPLYAKMFDVSFGVAALIVVASGVGGLVAGLPTGYLLDRVGRRKIILGAPICAALASFLMVLAQSFPELLVYRFLGGAATQMWMLGRLAIIADTGGAHQRGRQITSMHAIDSAGRISGPLVGGLIATVWDVRVPFLIHGVLCLIAVLPSFALIRETAPGTAPAVKGASTPERQRPIRRIPSWLLALPLLAFLAAQFLGAVTRGALNNGTLHFYAVYTYGVDAATIGVLATAAIAIGIPIMVAAGAVMDKLGRKATILPGFTLLGLALGFMAVTAHNQWSFPVYVAAFLLVVVTNTITTGNMQTLGSDIAPAHARGSFFGISQTVVQVGHVISPTSFAILADNVSATAGFLFLGVAALSVAVVVATVVADPTR